MITDEQRMDLAWMGYRRMADLCWAKPVGYCLVVFRTDASRVEAWFTGADGKAHLYSSAEYEDGRLKECLAIFEAYNLLPAGCNKLADTGFLSAEQAIEEML